MKTFIKHITPVALFILAIIAPVVIKADAGVLGKPARFSIEPWSMLRSRTLRPERAAPVLFEGRLYIASSRKKLIAFDLDGNKVFSRDLDFVPLATPAMAEGKVYLGGGDGYFHCLDLAAGDEIWSVELRTLDFSPAAIARGMVIFQTANDRIVALDKDTGEWRWEYQHLRGEDLAVKGLSVPVIFEGIAYLGLSDGAIAAMEADNGRLLWKTRVFTGEQFKDVDAPLQVDETSIYAVSISGCMAAISRKTGKVYWRYDSGGMAGCVLSGDAIYLATDDAELVAVDKVTGKAQWTTMLTDREKIRFVDLPTSPCVAGSLVITVSRDGRVIAVDGKTGRIVYNGHFHTETASPAIASDQGGFLFIDNKGIVRAWNLDSAGNDSFQ